MFSPVHNIGHTRWWVDFGLPQSHFHQHIQAIVVRMKVKCRRVNDMAGPELFEVLDQCRNNCLRGRGEQEMRYPLIREPKELSAGAIYSQGLDCGLRFSFAEQAEANFIFRANSPASFQHALRPGIIFSVGHKQNPDLGAGLMCILEKGAGSKGFIIGMRRYYQHPAVGVENGPGHGWGFRFTISTGQKPRSRACDHTRANLVSVVRGW